MNDSRWKSGGGGLLLGRRDRKRFGFMLVMMDHVLDSLLRVNDGMAYGGSGISNRKGDTAGGGLEDGFGLGGLRAGGVVDAFGAAVDEVSEP